MWLPLALTALTLCLRVCVFACVSLAPANADGMYMDGRRIYVREDEKATELA